MDLLFTRYADPFLFMDQMLLTGRFTEFVIEIQKITAKEKDDQTTWEFFLAKIHDKSFNDFKKDLLASVNAEKVAEADLETTVKESWEIVGGFNPEQEGGTEM